MAHKTSEYRIPQALVLDFDRMLGDVEACMARFYAVAEMSSVNVEEVREARMRIENDGGSFSPLKFVKDRLSTESYQRFCEQFVQDENPPVLYDDAARFLRMLQSSDVPHIILTYGVDSEWQQLKIAASKYRVGVIVTDHTDKGAFMSRLRSPDGMYRFLVDENGGASYAAASLCLIDDKGVAFKSLPSDCTGVLIRRGPMVLSQQGEPSQDIRVIQSLDQLVISEDGQLILCTNQEESSPYDMKRRMRPDSNLQQVAAVYRPLAITTE